ITLDHNLSRFAAASGTAGHLSQQLKRSLGRAEVGQRKRRVGANDTDEGNARKVVSLRNHLRADQNVDVPAAESAEHAFEIAAVPHRVAVSAADACIRINLYELGLEPFRSLAHIMDVLALALRTGRFWAPRDTAVMAKQLVNRAVIGQGNTAGVALKREST